MTNDTEPHTPDDADEPVATDAGQIEQSRILTALGMALAQFDGPPEDVVAVAKAAPQWARLDGELAGLVADSARSMAGAGAVRGVGSRHLSFENDAVSIEVAVGGPLGGAQRSLDGQVAPAGDVRLELHQRGSVQEIPLDELGVFAVDEVQPGLACFLVSSPTGVVHTPWFTV
ncbi:MAG: hypothetical protein OEY23_07615 [Acidimicrobiia bacterium]|nr:hypothetical protein [Acidimicrobiia bacterium]